METKLSKTPIQIGDYLFSIKHNHLSNSKPLENCEATVEQLNDMVYRIHVNHPENKYVDMDTVAYYVSLLYYTDLILSNYDSLSEDLTDEEFKEQYKNMSITIKGSSKFKVFHIIQLKWSSCILMIVDPLK